MVEQGMGVDKLGVQCNYHPYPSPLASYDDVVASRDLFMDTLKKFHASMGTKFMIPIVGGRDLDLHRLFVEVTSRGGVTKVLNDKRWKEVTSVFSFPSSATNASFILRKYYISLLYHYEQTYVFKAKYWTPSPTDTIQHLSAQGPPEYVISATQQQTHPPVHNTATLVPQAGSPVCGVIDGKFDSGYLITVKIGSEEFKGVLYQVPCNSTQTIQPNNNHNHHHQGLNSSGAAFLNLSSLKPATTRRKRRKKSEIRKRDPAHPKPNRSGYNFFFAEQHARLKPLYHGKDREISRIIGETWNKLKDPERTVYQEKALKDKERYKIEMEDYRERLRTGQIMRGAATVPAHHRPPVPEMNLNATFHFEENEMCSEMKSEKSGGSSEEEEEESDFGECSQGDAELKNVNIEVMDDDDVAFGLQTRPERDGDEERKKNNNNNGTFAEDGMSVPVEEMEQPSISSKNDDANNELAFPAL